MSEVVVELPRPVVAASVPARLSREVAALGARLARLLAGLATGGDGPLASGRVFLESMARAWWPGESCPRSGSAIERRPPGQAHSLDRLAHALALDAIEVDLLLLAAMPDEHEGYASVLRTLNPRGEGRAAVGLAVQLLCRDADERLALREHLLGGNALRHGIVSIAGEGGLYEQNLVLAPGLWPVLGGVDHWPDELRPIALGAATAGLDGWFAEPAVERAARALEARLPCTLVIGADTEALAADRAAALCAHAGVAAAGFDWPLPSASGDRLARVHTLARDVVPVFRVAAADGAPAPAMPGIDAHPGPLVFATRRGAAPALGDRTVIQLAATPLGASARIRMWRATLPVLAAHAPTLALRYPVEPAAAERIGRDARALADLDGAAVDLDLVAESVRARAQIHLTPGLNAVRPTARWHQLVLPAERKAQLAEALHRLEHQATVLDRWRFLEGRSGARGVRMLLCGPPGTGKTLAAEVLASALGVDLLVVDIARLVSKWIGETEKHLAAVFDAAERAQSVLLFDEADALFGRRTEISDAHDRYANLETAYLLSRLERFEGLAMLSTNLKHNIDPAFLRRLEFVVEFDLPGIAERAALWRCHLPAAAPLSREVDVQQLATLYPITGAMIRNASVAAAYRAAAAASAIGQAQLIAAIAREYEKVGKAFPGIPPGIALS